MTRKPRAIAASVRQRLLNLSRERKEDTKRCGQAETWGKGHRYVHGA